MRGARSSPPALCAVLALLFVAAAAASWQGSRANPLLAAPELQSCVRSAWPVVAPAFDPHLASDKARTPRPAELLSERSQTPQVLAAPELADDEAVPASTPGSATAGLPEKYEAGEPDGQQFAEAGAPLPEPQLTLQYSASSTSSFQAEDDQLVHLGAYAAGTNTLSVSAGVYSLRFEGDETIEYRLDTNNSNLNRGVLRVYEVSSDSYPLSTGGMCFYSSSGQGWLPATLKNYATLSSHAIVGDQVVFEYTDNVEGVHRRRYTFRLSGKALRIRMQSLDTDNLEPQSNYAGIWTGQTKATENPSIVQLQGALALPIVRFEDGAEQWFTGNLLDLFVSNASTYGTTQASLVVPTADSISFSSDTFGRYRANTDGQLSAPVDDTISVVVSSKASDCLARSTREASPYVQRVRHRTVVLLSYADASWDDYRENLDQFDAWGLDDLAVYTFAFWSASALEGFQNMGPDWYPAKDPGNLVALVQDCAARGVLFGLYTLFGPLPQSSPEYDASDLAIGTDGASKGPMAETAAIEHVQREADLIRANYGTTLSYTDVQSYSMPSDSTGDSVDESASSGYASTLREAILDRKRWFALLQSTMQGPLLGEGSIATQNSNLELLYTGYCDSLERHINSGAGSDSLQVPASDPKALTAWPVIPEYEWRVFARLQANHGNGFYTRFFGAIDGPAIVDAASQTLIYPLAEEGLDRYRLYELTYGHTSFFQSSGPWSGAGNSIELADMLKEYYLVNELQQRYFASPIAAIEYRYAGAWQSFEQVLDAAGSTDAFVDAQLRLSFENGLVLLLNHAKSSLIASWAGKTYTLPEDGFLAYQPGTSFLCFSAMVSDSAGQRVDWCNAPGRYKFFDGRGALTSYGGLTNVSGRARAENYLRGISVTEASNGELTTGTVPATSLVSVAIEPAVQYALLGGTAGFSAIASYANGATRDVTSLVGWSVSEPSVATIDASAACFAGGKGSTQVLASDYLGLRVTPATLTSFEDLGAIELEEAAIPVQ